MGKIGTIATVGAVGVAALVGLFAVQGLMASGVDLNPVNWGKNLGKWLQGAFSGNSDSGTGNPNNGMAYTSGGQAYNSDGSPIIAGGDSYGYFPDGTRYVIHNGVQTPSDADWIAAHPNSPYIINRQNSGQSGTSDNNSSNAPANSGSAGMALGHAGPSAGVAGSTFTFNTNSGGLNVITVPSNKTTNKPPADPTWGQVLASGYANVSAWRAATGS